MYKTVTLAEDCRYSEMDTVWLVDTKAGFRGTCRDHYPLACLSCWGQNIPQKC